MPPRNRRIEALSQIDASLTSIGKLARSRRAAEARRRRAGVDLPDTTIAALAAVYRHGPLRLGEVAAHMDLEPSRASKEIRRLVDDGLVRQQTDPHERRATVLTATPAGRSAFERYRAAVDALVADAFTGWTQKDLAEAAAVLMRIADTFARSAEPTTAQKRL